MNSSIAEEERGLMRVMARAFVRVYYPRLEIVDAARIPQSGPVLICANHANSLIDPVIIGIAARRPVRFMAKAPLFDHPILGPPMKALGMVPAYRARDDARQVRRNLESLDVGSRVLVEGQAMGIFPEGKSTDAAHLEMIRSGAARIALGAHEQGARGVLMIPLGITYEAKERFRTAVLVRVGEPIEVDAFVQRHEEEAKVRRELTGELEKRLKTIVVHLEQPEWEPWLEDLEALVPPADRRSQSTASNLWQRKRLADAINYFWEHDRPRAEAVAAEIADYRKAVHAAGLTVAAPVLRQQRPWVVLKLLYTFVSLCVLLAPAILGAIYHLIPFVLVRLIASRLDQPGKQTISTHRLLVGVPFYLVWYAVTAAAVWVLAAPWVSLLTLCLAPPLGLLALQYSRTVIETLKLLFYELRMLLNRRQLDRLRAQAARLSGQLDQLARDYQPE